MSARLATIYRCESCGCAEGLPQDRRDTVPQGWLSLPALVGLSTARTWFCAGCAAQLRGMMGRAAEPMPRDVVRRPA